MSTSSILRALGAVCLLVLSGCGASRDDVVSEARAASPTPAETAAPAETPVPAEAVTPGPAEPVSAATPPPAWLGTRVLATGPRGFGEVKPTPPELVDRRFVTTDRLAPPPDGEFAATVSEVPQEIAERSTWSEACPVALSDLRYIQLSFWGFDEQAHTGELLVHATVADDVVQVFQRLFERRFPIEEMRVVSPADLDAPPTGDGNNTTAFVCRPTRGSSSWSEHAKGLAVDVNPFHNPYLDGDLVLPELASAYTDRNHQRPGMVHEHGPVVSGFETIGWGWGGNWSSHLDWMHFSLNGR